MGQCCTKKQNEEQRPYKQNKNIDDKRMFKIGVEVLRKDFCVQIGYNRRAVKNYNDVNSSKSLEPQTEGLPQSIRSDNEENNDDTQQTS